MYKLWWEKEGLDLEGIQKAAWEAEWEDSEGGGGMGWILRRIRRHIKR